MKKTILILLLAAFMAVSLGGCFGVNVRRYGDEGRFWGNAPDMRTSGDVQSRDYDIADFTGVATIGNFSDINVHLSQGDYAVRVEADSAYFDELELNVRRDVLQIDSDRYLMTRQIDVYITAPDFQYIDAMGAPEFDSDGILSGGELTINIAGAARIDLELEYDALFIDSAGASDVYLSGTVEEMDYSTAGAASLKARDLATNRCSVTISGAGEAEVRCEGELTARINGAGAINYWGNPQLDKSIAGIGTISGHRD